MLQLQFNELLFLVTYLKVINLKLTSLLCIKDYNENSTGKKCKDHKPGQAIIHYLSDVGMCVFVFVYRKLSFGTKNAVIIQTFDKIFANRVLHSIHIKIDNLFVYKIIICDFICNNKNYCIRYTI